MAKSEILLKLKSLVRLVKAMKGILHRRLEVIKKQKELLLAEEAKMVRMAMQKRERENELKKLIKIKKEKFAIMAEEAKLLRFIKQAS